MEDPATAVAETGPSRGAVTAESARPADVDLHAPAAPQQAGRPRRLQAVTTERAER